MSNQYAVDIPTLPVNQCHAHLIQFLVECKAVIWECRAAEIGRQAFGTRMVYRETFLQIQRRLLQHLIRKSPIVKAKHQLWIRDASQDRQPEIHWTSEGIFSNKYGPDQERLQISDPHFDKFPNTATFACWKIRFKTEVCTAHNFLGSYAVDQGSGVG